MNITICDDHLTFIESIATLLGDRGHIVVGWSTRPDDTANLHLPGVDVIVVDLQFPGVQGTEAVEIVHRSIPGVPIVVLTAYADVSLVEQAFDQGASGAALKTETVEELEMVLSKVHNGHAAQDAERNPRVRSRQIQALRKRRQPRGTGPHLTDRELDVLEGLTVGRTTAEIAASMGVEISTVRTHVQHLLAKFGAHSRLELVASARRAKVGRARFDRDQSLRKLS